MSAVAVKQKTLSWEDAPPFGRRETLLHALHRLHELHPGPSLIVETGTLRNESGSGLSGDGWSTVAWGWYASQTNSRVVTVDINPDAMETCRRVTEPYSRYVEYVVSDSVAYLHSWLQCRRERIELLYLDSFDYIDHERSESHCLGEAEAALPLLSEACLVLFDDTSPTGTQEDEFPVLTGKGKRAVPFLVSQGFAIESMAGGQILLSRHGSGGFTS